MKSAFMRTFALFVQHDSKIFMMLQALFVYFKEYLIQTFSTVNSSSLRSLYLETVILVMVIK